MRSIRGAFSTHKTALIGSMVLLMVSIALNFGVRYIYVFRYSGFDNVTKGISADAEDYLQIAYAVAVAGQYGRPTGVNVKETLLAGGESQTAPPAVVPDGWRPPLWPVVLAGMLKLSGFNLTGVFYLRFVLDIVTLLLFYGILVLLGLSWIGRILALLIFALHPAWILYSGTLLSEPLTLLVQVALALGVVLLLKARSHRLWWAGLCGALSGFCILAHPYFIFFPLLLAAILYLRKHLVRREAAIMAGCLALVVTPWVVRNMIVYDSAVPILTTSIGPSLIKGWNSQFLNAYRNTTADTLDESVDIDGATARQLASSDQAEASAIHTAAAANFIRTNWRLVPAIVSRKIVGALTPVPETTRAGILESGRMIFQLIAFIPLGLVLTKRFGGAFQAIALALLIGYLIMAIATFPTIRYRFPLIWVEMIGVGMVADNLLKKLWPHSKEAKAAEISLQDGEDSATQKTKLQHEPKS